MEDKAPTFASGTGPEWGIVSVDEFHIPLLVKIRYVDSPGKEPNDMMVIATEEPSGLGMKESHFNLPGGWILKMKLV